MRTKKKETYFIGEQEYEFGGYLDLDKEVVLNEDGTRLTEKDIERMNADICESCKEDYLKKYPGEIA